MRSMSRGLAARISASGSGAATTSISRPSSSARRIAAAQHYRLGEIEHKGCAFDALHDDAAAKASFVIEHDRVKGRAHHVPAVLT